MIVSQQYLINFNTIEILSTTLNRDSQSLWLILELCKNQIVTFENFCDTFTTNAVTLEGSSLIAYNIIEIFLSTCNIHVTGDNFHLESFNMYFYCRCCQSLLKPHGTNVVWYGLVSFKLYN